MATKYIIRKDGFYGKLSEQPPVPEAKVEEFTIYDVRNVKGSAYPWEMWTAEGSDHRREGDSWTRKIKESAWTIVLEDEAQIAPFVEKYGPILIYNDRDFPYLTIRTEVDR